MKRGTPDHPKMKALSVALGITQAHAVGIMECLWHFAAKYAMRGDIGRWSDEDIATGAKWEGDAQTLVNALVTCRWLDRCADNRLVIHDWSQHCDESVKKTLGNRKESFATFRESSRKKRKDSESFRPSLAIAKPEPSHSQSHQQDGAAKPLVGECSETQAQAIYDLYPRHEGRGAAIKAIRAATKKLAARGEQDPIGFLTEAVTAYRNSKAVATSEKRFIPHPSTWFNEGRYDDDRSEWNRARDNAQPATLGRVAAPPGKYDRFAAPS